MSKKISQRSINKSSAIALRSLRNARQAAADYSAFDQIDGRHPWQSEVPEGFVGYPVKALERGKVLYFNFALAKEMGLIAQDHPHKFTEELCAKLIETFSIQIINEYDQLNSSPPPKSRVKQYTYMATRYLQLQHTNKQGKTSGDGRSIWNGTLRHKGTTWDISSRGTGVTCLSPGAAQADVPLRTGGEEFGYGCGLADVTELWGSAVMSEIFHLNGIGTERVLVIIDLGRGCGIGVRAAPNLVRPAHLFLYLKQGRIEELKQATDYLIRREVENGNWKISLHSGERYKQMLKEVSTSFARFAARLEREYIFAWMDWDGDNVLASGGIIDYGSIRQFGLRHDQYRYDDVERFSTTLNEQRGKARLTVQVFAQLTDFLVTGKRRSMEDFNRHEALRAFDREFDRELRHVFLMQVGLDERQAKTMLEKNASGVERVYNAYIALEKTKTKAGVKKVADGMNRPAVFRMRAILREMPELLMKVTDLKPNSEPVSPEDLVDLMSSSFAKRADLRLKGKLGDKISAFQKTYVNLILFACGSSAINTFMRALSRRAKDENRRGRVTGNGSEFIVDALTRAKRRGVSNENVQAALELFIASQVPSSALPTSIPKLTSMSSETGALYQELLNICVDFEDDI
jgi:uncharacterized protein YdiU (UPF0061 family)